MKTSLAPLCLLLVLIAIVLVIANNFEAPPYKIELEYLEQHPKPQLS